MKRSFKNLFMVIMILVSLVGSSIQVASVDALGTFEKETLGSMPPSLNYGRLVGAWSIDENNLFTIGYGKEAMGETYPKRPLAYQKKNGAWSSSSPALPVVNWGNGEFNAVWGATASSVFAVGSGGTGITPNSPMAARWNGTSWTSDYVPLPTTPGSPVAFNTGYLYGVWGPSDSDVYAVGNGRTILGAIYPLIAHWDGAAWTSKSLLPSGWQYGYLYGIWGTGPSDIYAVGNGGNGVTTVPLIYHYNGSAWSASSLPLPTGWGSGYLVSIWGTTDIAAGTTDIYVVGSGKNSLDKTSPLLYHYNGSKWTAANLSLPSADWSQGELKAVWGSGSKVYATGYGFNGSVIVSFLYRKTRNGWALSTYPPSGVNLTEHYLGISGSSTTDIYTVGFSTIIEAQYPSVYHAVADGIAPGSLSDLSVVDTESFAIPEMPGGIVSLTWTAPADDGYDVNSGPADSYVVKYSTNPLADCTGGDTPTSYVPEPATPGTTQNMVVSGLEIGTSYNFAICAVDEDGRSSDAATITATAIESLGMYDDTNSSLWSYSAGSTASHWKPLTASGAYDGTYQRTTTKGATASLVFQAPAFFTFYYQMSPKHGSFSIYVDGVLLKTINAYSAKTIWQKKYLSPAITGNELHTVMIKHVSATGKHAVVDAIKFIPAPQPVSTGTYDDIDPQWLYSANWIAGGNANAYDGTIHSTSKKGSSATFVFQAPGRFVLYYRTGSNRGSFSIYVDGTLVKTVNAYSAKTVWQKKYTSPIYSDNKSHTIVIKHVSPTGKYIDIDAIRIE